MSRIKNKLYDWLVRKNEWVRYEYERYVMEHTVEHYEHRLLHWKMLWKLNWHYRIRKKKTPLLYWDINTEEKKVGQKVAALTIQEKGQAKRQPVSKEEKLPYLEGAESNLFMRQAPHYACRNLSKYDVVSFDIFDTLIFRPFSKPIDLFMILGEKYHICNFQKIRVDAEKRAREQHAALFGNTEATIFDIYEIIEKMTGIPKELGVQNEFECELEFVRPNPYCKRLFDLLKEQEVRIIACSDMYLPKTYISELLLKCGYDGFEDIFVSCDYTFSKRNKGMYKMIRNKYGVQCKIVHIGDNYGVDVTAAQECGMDAIFIKNCNIAGMQYRAEGMSPLIGSAYAGIVNMHLHTGLKSYTPYYEYGFIYGGIYVLGYCNWIYEHARKNNVDRIFFLSRDGYIYKKVFDYLYPNIETKYVYWSRIASQKYVMDCDFNDFLTKMIIHKINNPNVHDSIEDLLGILGLECFIPRLGDYKLTKEEEILETNKESLIMFFNENKGDMIEYIKEEREQLKECFEYFIGEAQNISIVDVGWIGSGPMAIKYLINNIWKMDKKIYCLVAANRHYNDSANASAIASKDIESYMFNSSCNVELLKFHSSTNKNTNNLYFEMFTQAPMPAFAGVDRYGEFLFELPEVENYEQIEQIHQGISDFVVEYTTIFKNYSWMYNISGHDAYMPFKMIVKNLKFIKHYLGQMTYARTVGTNKKERKIETLSEIMDALSL